MILSEEYIFGEKFESEFNLPPNFYYCKIDYVWQFLNICKNFDYEFTLITHNGDLPVTQQMADFIGNITNLRYWFAQNVECENERIHSIPIGLENTKNFTKYSKKDLLYSYSSKNITPDKLLYANFSFYTNPSERIYCHQNIKKFKFLTDKCGDNVGFEDYQIWLSEVLQHHYVICPRGNGIDTHRLWETLYLGRIPIVKRCKNTKFYENLPILFIDDWSELTEEMLFSKLGWFNDKSNFNMELLKMSYWKNKIFNSIK